jgi:hypothetical protein
VPIDKRLTLDELVAVVIIAWTVVVCGVLAAI